MMPEIGGISTGLGSKKKVVVVVVVVVVQGEKQIIQKKSMLPPNPTQPSTSTPTQLVFMAVGNRGIYPAVLQVAQRNHLQPAFAAPRYVQIQSQVNPRSMPVKYHNLLPITKPCCRLRTFFHSVAAEIPHSRSHRLWNSRIAVNFPSPP